MSLTLQEMRSWVRKGLGNLDTSDLTDSEVDALLNMSLWALEDKYPFRAREKNVTTSTAVGQFLYDLSGITRLDAIESVAVLTDDGAKRHKLARTDRNWWDVNFSTEDIGTPDRYFREDNCLYLTPVPDEVIPLHIKLRQGVASLVEGLVEATGLPRNWDEIVVQGAIWRGHFFNEDYNRAQQAANFQIGLIRSSVPTEAKEEKDSRFAGLNVLTEWPVEYE